MMLTRPDPMAAGGALTTPHFQIAYATNDLDQAVALFAREQRITRFRRVTIPIPEGGEIHVALAWAGGVMFELVTAQGAGADLYTGRLPAGGGFAMRHHHFGYVMPDVATWDRLRAESTARGCPPLGDTVIPGVMRHCFVDAPALGHYLEYFLLEPTGKAMLEAIPAN